MLLLLYFLIIIIFLFELNNIFLRQFYHKKNKRDKMVMLDRTIHIIYLQIHSNIRGNN